jgi:microcystin-dependent protein
MLPYIGEIKMVPFTDAPRDWAQCNGQLLSIKDNMPLFSIIGFTYGGDGKTFFNLPDMRGRAPIGAGEGDGLWGYNLGDKAGAEQPVTKDVQTKEGSLGVLQTAESTDAGQAVVNGQFSNMQPSVALNFIIALRGIFPSAH